MTLLFRIRGLGKYGFSCGNIMFQLWSARLMVVSAMLSKSSGDPYLQVNMASVSSAAPLHSESESTSQHHLAKFTYVSSESSMGFPKKPSWPEMVFWSWHFRWMNILEFTGAWWWHAVAFFHKLRVSVDWRLWTIPNRLQIMCRPKLFLEVASCFEGSISVGSFFL